MTATLSAAQRDAYARDGYLFPLPALTGDEVAAARASLAATEARLGGRLDGRMNQKPHLLFPWADALIRHAAILDAVEGLIGPDILCWGSQFFIKPAGDPAFVSWHQDATYWGLSSADVVTAWVALSPSTRASGCLKVVPGTHRAQVAHTDTYAETNLLSRGQEIAVAVDEADAVAIELAPGAMSLHHVLLFHGSAPNTAEHARIGFAIRFVPPHVHQLDGAKGSATLVRGSDATGHWVHEQRPAADMHPDAVAHHAAVLDRQLAVVYAGSGGRGKLAAAM
jgi:ectoine hydroxylase-related dioxygenase (phytanoyl-CoA dioxygenase family)